MVISNSSQNLATIIDPGQMHFYLESEGIFLKLNIRRVLQSMIILDQIEALVTQSRDVSGFIVLKDQRGILFLQGYLKDPASMQEKFDISELHTKAESYQIKNRRNFFRYQSNIKTPTKISLGQKSLEVQICNYSAGGMLIESNESLNEQDIYAMDTQLEIFEGEKLFANVKVVYLLQKDLNKTNKQYGAYFLNFSLGKARKMLNLDDVQNRIIRDVNKKLLADKKIK